MEEKKTVKVTVETPDGEVMVLEGDFASVTVGTPLAAPGTYDTTNIVYAGSYGECQSLYQAVRVATGKKAHAFMDEHNAQVRANKEEQKNG